MHAGIAADSIGYNQSRFIDSVSKELGQIYPRGPLPTGYCNGLSSLWAYMKASGQEAEFHRLYTSIIERNRQAELSYEMKRFIRNVAFFQAPDVFDIASGIIQSEFEQAICQAGLGSLRVECEFKLGFNFSQEELPKILALLPANKIIFLCSPDHIVALMKEEDAYAYYDANIGIETKVAAEDMAQILFTHLNQDCCGRYLPLEIRVYRDSEKASSVYPRNLDIIRPFLKRDPDFTRDDAWPGETALRSALRIGDLNTVEHLLLWGAQITPEDVELAALEKQFKAVRFLEEQGLDIGPALLIYARYDLDEAAKELVEQGMSDGYLKEALLIAVQENSFFTAKMLLERGVWSAKIMGLIPTADGALRETLQRYAAYYRNSLPLHASLKNAAHHDSAPGAAR